MKKRLMLILFIGSASLLNACEPGHCMRDRYYGGWGYGTPYEYWGSSPYTWEINPNPGYQPFYGGLTGEALFW